MASCCSPLAIRQNYTLIPSFTHGQWYNILGVGKGWDGEGKGKGEGEESLTSYFIALSTLLIISTIFDKLP